MTAYGLAGGAAFAACALLTTANDVVLITAGAGVWLAVLFVVALCWPSFRVDLISIADVVRRGLARG